MSKKILAKTKTKAMKKVATAKITKPGKPHSTGNVKAVYNSIVKTQIKKDKPVTETVRHVSRTPSAAPIMEPGEIKKAIAYITENQDVSEYLKKNVSRNSIDVISLLATPRTDEYISEQLGLKINAVRRILNIMQGYGLTNYYVAKNTNGWLSFAWYVNPDKAEAFAKQVNAIKESNTVIQEECNDYFFCKSCYDNDKLVFTFDAAFEVNFKCSCGKSLVSLDKDSVKALLKG
ncbi:MAG: hypothetical protein M1564_02740 [Candidatus Marsarchaeota archaeon]|nr:hypothetical protein [Candidatus Marsarchaeota archaeon]